MNQPILKFMKFDMSKFCSEYHCYIKSTLLTAKFVLLFDEQRAQRKALDILNTVGLSNSVLKLVERRHRVDKWIAYTGMAVTIIVVYWFWKWTH